MFNEEDLNRLLKEIQRGNAKTLSDLKEKDPDFHWLILRREKTGDTALHVASRLGHYDLVRFLIEQYRPNCVNCRNLDGKTPLHDACQFVHYDIVKLLLESGANVNALKRSDWTPLMLACTKKQPDSVRIVKELLQHNALVDYANKDGWSALHLVCREGDLSIFNLLKEYSVDLNKRTKNGRTGLHVAALHGNVPIVNALLENGVDLNAVDCCGNAPLHEAILGNSVDAFKTLIEHGANLNAVNKEGFGLLHFAASEGHLNLIESLIVDFKFDVNQCSRRRFTPLHCAAKKNKIEAYKLLVELGGDETIIDRLDRTASCYFNESL